MNKTVALRIANIDESRVYPRQYFQRHLGKYHQFGDDLNDEFLNLIFRKTAAM